MQFSFVLLSAFFAATVTAVPAEAVIRGHELFQRDACGEPYCNPAAVSYPMQY